MELIEPLIAVADKNLDYAKRLVADVPDEKMTVQPAPGMNHAAWVIGHLAFVTDLYGAQLGVSAKAPKEWADLLGNNSRPVADRSKYPAKAQLLSFLEEAHQRLCAGIRAKEDAFWRQPPALERWRPRQSIVLTSSARMPSRSCWFFHWRSPAL